MYQLADLALQTIKNVSNHTCTLNLCGRILVHANNKKTPG